MPGPQTPGCSDSKSWHIVACEWLASSFPGPHRDGEYSDSAGPLENGFLLYVNIWSLRCQSTGSCHYLFPLMSQKNDYIFFLGLVTELHDGDGNKLNMISCSPELLISVLHYPQRQNLKWNFREEHALFFPFKLCFILPFIVFP